MKETEASTEVYKMYEHIKIEIQTLHMSSLINGLLFAVSQIGYISAPINLFDVDVAAALIFYIVYILYLDISFYIYIFLSDLI